MGHLPITGFSAYDRFGLPYDVARVLTPAMELNVTAYESYSPVYLPMTFALTYFISFMMVTAVMVHTILYDGRAILSVLRGKESEKDDIHAKLMRRYPEVPTYYFLGLFAIFFPMLIGATKVGTRFYEVLQILTRSLKLKDFDVPIWSLFLAILLPAIFIVPCTYIYARSGTSVSINLIAELIPGAILPGQPFANMVGGSLLMEEHPSRVTAF